jgi:hypothetical protein
MTSLEGWGSAIELRPRDGRAATGSVPGLRAGPDRADEGDWAKPSPLLDLRQFLAGLPHVAEQVASLGYPVQDRSDREPVGAERWVIQL